MKCLLYLFLVFDLLVIVVGEFWEVSGLGWIVIFVLDCGGFLCM